MSSSIFKNNDIVFETVRTYFLTVYYINRQAIQYGDLNVPSLVITRLGVGVLLFANSESCASYSMYSYGEESIVTAC